jgi:hypothetical protein
MLNRTAVAILFVATAWPAVSIEAAMSVENVAHIETHTTGLPVVVAEAGENRAKLRMVIDTAAGATVLFSDTVQRLAIGDAQTKTEVQGAAATTSVNIRTLPVLRFAGARMSPLNVVEMAKPPQLTDLDGVLGSDFLGDRIVEFNLAQGTVTFLKKAPVASNWTIAPLRLVSRISLVNGTINGRPVTLVIDTGATRSVANGLVSGLLGQSAATSNATPRAVSGVGTGSVSARMLEIAKIDLAKIPMGQGQLAIADLPVFKALGLAEQPAIILGADRLRGHHFIIDYPNRRLLLDKHLPG